MATQEGIISYSGKLGDTVGYRRGKELYARKLNTHCALTNETQKSGAEFGYGSKACVLAKHALAPLMLRPFKAGLHNRLAEAFRKVIRSGPMAKKGQRTVYDGNVALLAGFEFNTKQYLASLLPLNFKLDYNEGKLNLAFDAIDWLALLRKPDKAGAVVLNLGVAFLDFTAATYHLKLAPAIKITNNAAFKGGSLNMEVPAAKEQLILVVANLYFEREKECWLIDQQLYQAGKCLAALHLRNGQLVVFEPEPAVQQTPPEKPVPNLVWDLNG